MKLILNMTHNDLEARSIGENKIEIVKWVTTDTRHCYTLAIFQLGTGGYELGFIGNRPFDDTIRDDFWIMAKMIQNILDVYWCNRRN